MPGEGLLVFVFLTAPSTTAVRMLDVQPEHIVRDVVLCNTPHPEPARTRKQPLHDGWQPTNDSLLLPSPAPCLHSPDVSTNLNMMRPRIGYACDLAIPIENAESRQKRCQNMM